VSPLAYVVDSTADLPEAVVSRRDVRTIPLRINWDDQSLRDRVDISTNEFYQRLRSSSSMPKTGAPPPGDFEQAYEELLTTHDGIVSIHLPGSLSGTYSAALAAAERIDARRIEVVEGGHVSLGLGWLAECAAGAGDSSDDLAQAASAAREMVERVRLFAALDTLEFLKRGGRIGRVAALAGALLNVKPLLEIDNGQVLPLERVRSRGAALRRLRALTGEVGRLERIAVLHGDASESAEELSQALAEDFPSIPIERGEISPVVGVHAGPGIVGVTCILAR
jgi:DegV family protein with EDD domain